MKELIRLLDERKSNAEKENETLVPVEPSMGAGGSVVMHLQMSREEAELVQEEIRAALSQCDYVTERDGTHAEDVRGLEERIAGANRVSVPTHKLRQLVLDLWSFIENSGSTEEFFALWARVREVMK